MVRCSSAYSICTNRPNFNEAEYTAALDKFRTKVIAKLGQFDIRKIDEYVETSGLITDAKKIKILLTKKYLAEEDPLPDGAKSYLEKRWLELNYNFYDFSVRDDSIQILKGNVCEDEAIKVIGERYNFEVTKNEKSKSIPFLSGTCDMTYNSVIRDCKVPQTWKTFRKVTGIPPIYYWQLVAYCILWECSNAYLDYVLMPVPGELIPNFIRGYSEQEVEKFYREQDTIKNLPLRHRVKTYKIHSNLEIEKSFLKSRLEKAEAYYNSLTYEKCMKMFA